MEAAFSLPRRSREPELMDSEPTGYESFAACLRDLERINRASFGYRPTLSWLDAVAQAQGGAPLRILDVGCGGGDMLRQVRRWSRRRGVPVVLTGIDVNPWSTRAARAATPASMDINYETANLFDIDEARDFDVILSALFAHHLADAELLRFLRWMERTARVGWFVNDLHRHWIAERGLEALFGLLPVHRFVRHDGPASVRRAFSRRDLMQLVEAAGLPPDSVSIRWHFPFRWGLGTRAA